MTASVAYLMIAAHPALAATTNFTNKSNWRAAAGGGTGQIVDNLNSGSKVGGTVTRNGYTISGNGLAAFPNTNATTAIDGGGHIRALLDANSGERIVFNFDRPVTAVGFQINPFSSHTGAALLLGPNNGDGWQPYALPANDNTGFRGIVADTPFTEVIIQVGTQDAWHGIDNLEIFFPPAPQIELETGAGDSLINGVSSIDLGGTLVGSHPNSVDLVIRNLGGEALTDLDLSLSGSHASDFSIGSPSSSSVPTSGSTDVSLNFQASNLGLRSATLSIASNDPENSPFVLQLEGTGLGFETDSDSDGLNDGAERSMAALGFDWTSPQPDLVDTYFNSANYADLYTGEQIHGMQLGRPTLEVDSSGRVKVNFYLNHSDDLSEFQPIDLSDATVEIAPGTGRIELDFPASGDTAFYQVEAE